MRNTLDTIDPLPAFPSDGIAFVLEDAEPAYQPSERHKRLPSYRAMRPSLSKPLNDVLSLLRFESNCDSHITEADCRKRVEQPKQAPAEQPAAPQFKVGDRVRVVNFKHDSRSCVQSGDELTIARVDGVTRYWFDESPRTGESEFFMTADSLELLPSEQPKADADGWVEWRGGKCCPVPAGTEFEVRLRDGHHMKGMYVTDWLHSFAFPSSDIVAYRVIA